jgi:dienelactone hydrolase
MMAREGVAESLCNQTALPGRLILRPANGAARPDYYLFLPEDIDPARPPLVSVHGISRNAEEHAQAFAETAAQQRRPLIAPHFDEARFDGFQRLARGTEAAVEDLWRDVEGFAGISFKAVDMVGFSGGAQFTHRYAMLNPQRVNSQVLVAAGWYTFPSSRDRFPYGIRQESRRGRRAAENLSSFLAIPTLVLVGERDNQRDAGLRRTPEVDIKQGINRIERASRWSCALLQAATRAGVSPTVQFSMLPGCGHAFDGCVDKGGLVGLVSHWLQRDRLL